MPGIEQNAGQKVGQRIIGKFTQVSESLIQRKGLRGIFAEIRKAASQRSHDSISWLEGKRKPGLFGQMTEAIRLWAHKRLSGLRWVGKFFDRAEQTTAKTMRSAAAPSAAAPSAAASSGGRRTGRTSRTRGTAATRRSTTASARVQGADTASATASQYSATGAGDSLFSSYRPETGAPRQPHPDSWHAQVGDWADDAAQGGEELLGHHADDLAAGLDDLVGS